jgi:hypothetical protein
MKAAQRILLVSLALSAFFAFVAADRGERFWDVFRPINETAIVLDVITTAVVLIVALALFIISSTAYSKHGSKRFMFIGWAFFFFAVKEALTLADYFVSPGDFFSRYMKNVFDLVALLLFFLAIFKK